MDTTLRDNLSLLADAILPLETWLGGTPGQRTNVLAPWRGPFTPHLTTRDLGLLDFIERQIADSSVDDALARKWEQVERHPLAVFDSLPEKGPAWRAERPPLAEKPTFALVKSENVEVILDRVGFSADKTPIGRASSRREFYGHAFAAFTEVVSTQPPSDWEQFRDRLLSDDPTLNWPVGCPVSAGRFVRQFAKDLLYGLLGMHDQPASLQATAVLAELGQHRRKGNSYSTENARAAVAALELRLRTVKSAIQSPESRGNHDDL